MYCLDRGKIMNPAFMNAPPNMYGPGQGQPPQGYGQPPGGGMPPQPNQMTNGTTSQRPPGPGI